MFPPLFSHIGRHTYSSNQVSLGILPIGGTPTLSSIERTAYAQ